MNRIHNTRKRLTAAKGEGGFTLIELLIVIVVLGILAAVVVFALGGVTGQSAVAACNADAKTVSVAVSAALAENKTPSQGELVTDGFLKSWPNSSYYAITLSGANDVQVGLTGGQNADPGEKTGANGTSPLPATTGVGVNYEGGSAWTWATDNTIGATATDNICKGA